MANKPDSLHELQLAPPSDRLPESPTIVESFRSVPVASEPPAQFSLRWLFVLMTVGCVLLSLGRLFDPGQFAGLCGILTIVFPLLTAALNRFDSPHMESLWWTLLLVYLVAIGIAAHHNIAQH